MKVTLEYTLPEETDEYETAMNGLKYKMAFEEVWERLIRAAFKHGFSNEKLNQLQSSNPELFSEIFEEVTNIYNEIREEHEL